VLLRFLRWLDLPTLGISRVLWLTITVPLIMPKGLAYSVQFGIGILPGVVVTLLSLLTG
jgi:hypothetical protein